MFDNIYVLAKGGVCVYSGPPTALRQHLNECNVECNENQVPIEVLIKTSFEGFSDTKVQNLCQKTEENNNYFKNNLNYMKVIRNGLKKKVKNFSFIDFWYVLLRLCDRTFISNISIFVIQLSAFFVVIASCLLVIDPNVYRSDGCFQLNVIPNISCAQQREVESLSATYAIFSIFLMVFSVIILCFIIGFNYVNDLKIFVSEHRSCEFLNNFHLVLNFIYLDL